MTERFYFSTLFLDFLDHLVFRFFCFFFFLDWYFKPKSEVGRQLSFLTMWVNFKWYRRIKKVFQMQFLYSLQWLAMAWWNRSDVARMSWVHSAADEIKKKKKLEIPFGTLENHFQSKATGQKWSIMVAIWLIHFF